eukprot:2544113-Amphidinium_carterae.1
MVRNRQSLRSQDQLEFRTELDSIGEITDVAQRHQNVNHQLELRTEQVTSMSQTTVAKLHK